jgi:hypothetical protein
LYPAICNSPRAAIAFGVRRLPPLSFFFQFFLSSMPAFFNSFFLHCFISSFLSQTIRKKGERKERKRREPPQSKDVLIAPSSGDDRDEPVRRRFAF